MKKIVTDIRNGIVYQEDEVNKIISIDEDIEVDKKSIVTFFSGMGEL